MKRLAIMIACVVSVAAALAVGYSLGKRSKTFADEGHTVLDYNPVVYNFPCPGVPDDFQLHLACRKTNGTVWAGVRTLKSPDGSGRGTADNDGETSHNSRIMAVDPTGVTVLILRTVLDKSIGDPKRGLRAVERVEVATVFFPFGQTNEVTIFGNSRLKGYYIQPAT
jgi:hypothetical protein